MHAAQAHALEVRKRLLNPTRPVIDRGIHLRPTGQIPLVPVVAEPLPAIVVYEPAVPEPAGEVAPSDIAGMVIQIRSMRTTLNGLSAQCAKILKDNSRKGPKVAEIIRAVGEHYDCTRLDIVSQRRDMAIITPRHVAVYLCRQLTTLSLVDIGQVIGGRDHGTIIHAINKMERLRSVDMQLDASITMLTERLSAQ